MNKLFIAGGVLVALAAVAVPTLVKETPVTAAQKSASQCVSGFAPGEGTPAFDVKDVTGPWKDAPKVCYI